MHDIPPSLVRYKEVRIVTADGCDLLVKKDQDDEIEEQIVDHLCSLHRQHRKKITTKAMSGTSSSPSKSTSS